MLVTGAAGFIGSTLVEKLLDSGYDVIGLDCFTNYYSKEQKLSNIQKARSNKNYKFIEADILEVNLEQIIRDVNGIFHLAAQPGVRPSWTEFDIYVRNNILATKKLLDVASGMEAKKFVFASSSSVYGDAESFPTSEDAVPRPVSPYGITKDTCEKLCYVYHKSYQFPITMLRFFTVYGPRQRPDMGFHKFIEKILSNQKITVFGDGSQIRDFTYVNDIVQGIIAALISNSEFETYNLGSGRPIRLIEAIKIMQDIIGEDAEIEYFEPQLGDAIKTLADIRNARQKLGYEPKTKLGEGLQAQVEWHRAKNKIGL